MRPCLHECMYIGCLYAHASVVNLDTEVDSMHRYTGIHVGSFSMMCAVYHVKRLLISWSLRLYVLYRLPSLCFLDSSPVSAEECKEAKRVGQFMRVVKPSDTQVRIECVCACVRACVRIAIVVYGCMHGCVAVCQNWQGEELCNRASYVIGV